MPTDAPQIDHANYPKSLKGRSDDSLRFTIKDCQAAMKAMPDNPKCGYYADEIHYCGMELHSRTKAAQDARREARKPSNLTKYKQAARVAQRYNQPLQYCDPKADAHEEKWNEKIDKCEAIEELLTAAERKLAIIWLSANEMYGYMGEVC